MYRNAPEHPRIKEILRNGEISEGEHQRFDAENDSRNFELNRVYEMSEEEFTEICIFRSMTRRLLAAEPSFAGLARKGGAAE